jgi:hypothetical protein
MTAPGYSFSACYLFQRPCRRPPSPSGYGTSPCRKEAAMKYMFLIYLDEAKFAVLTQAERDAFGNAILD